MSLAPSAPSSPEAARTLHRKLCTARALVWASYIGLLVLFTGLFLLDPIGRWSLWLVQVLPLAIFLPGLWRGGHRAYSWLCFVVLIYFIGSVTDAFSPLAQWHDYLVLALSVLLFVSAMLASRWRQQWWLWQHTVESGQPQKERNRE